VPRREAHSGSRPGPMLEFFRLSKFAHHAPECERTTLHVLYFLVFPAHAPRFASRRACASGCRASLRSPACPRSKREPVSTDAESHWTRFSIPPTQPLDAKAQWHIDAARRTIVCDGNGAHEWLRFNQELGNFDFSVKWRFTPVPGTPKYNSGVFFRNSADGAIWHQRRPSWMAATCSADPRNGTPTAFNLLKDMAENRVKPAGE